jgi:hypothetical protein
MLTVQLLYILLNKICGLFGLIDVMFGSPWIFEQSAMHLCLRKTTHIYTSFTQIEGMRKQKHELKNY